MKIWDDKMVVIREMKDDYKIADVIFAPEVLIQIKIIVSLYNMRTRK